MGNNRIGIDRSCRRRPEASPMSDGGAVVAIITTASWILGIMAALYVPLLYVRFMEWKSGDPLWLGHRLFGKDVEHDGR